MKYVPSKGSSQSESRVTGVKVNAELQVFLDFVRSKVVEFATQVQDMFLQFTPLCSCMMK